MATNRLRKEQFAHRKGGKTKFSLRDIRQAKRGRGETWYLMEEYGHEKHYITSRKRHIRQ